MKNQITELEDSIEFKLIDQEDNLYNFVAERQEQDQYITKEWTIEDLLYEHMNEIHKESANLAMKKIFTKHKKSKETKINSSLY